jgi:ABC-type multidrug transport system fused ATPase/permease subunit
MAADARDLKHGPGLVELWVGVLTGPIAALTQLEANYALVLWACQRAHEWPLHLVSLIALVVTIAAGMFAIRNWQWAGRQIEDDGAGAISRGHFMAVVGTLISALTSLVIIAQWLPVFAYGPCER